MNKRLTLLVPSIISLPSGALEKNNLSPFAFQLLPLFPSFTFLLFYYLCQPF